MKVKHLHSEAELKEIITTGKTILMIHKTNCPFCEKAEPWLDEFAEHFKEITITSINKDNLPNLLEAFNLVMYPTFVAINEGQVVDTFYGNTDYNLIKEFISKL